ELLQPPLHRRLALVHRRLHPRPVRARGGGVPPARPRPAHAPAAGLRPDRLLHLAGGEHQHPARRLAVPQPAWRLGHRAPGQVELVVAAGGHDLHHRRRPQAREADHRRPGAGAACGGQAALTRRPAAARYAPNPGNRRRGSMHAETLATLDTPALVLDRGRMETNIRRMRKRAAALGVTLRPHLKTCKSADVARRMVDPGDPVTVSTLREAEYFAGEGFTDIFYAVAIDPARLDRVAALQRRGARILLAVDSFEAARGIVLGGERLGVRFEALVEIDCGDGRSGIAADAPQLLDIAAVLAGGAGLVGVFTHGGHSYAGRTAAQHAEVAEQERRA